MELSELKKEYARLMEKYGLPTFKELNESFEIEKIDKESEILLRNIRKFMMEKIVNSMNFVEMFFNSMNAPRMYLPFINTMSVEDRKIIENIYKKFAELILNSLSNEIAYSEKKEAELVIKINNVWDSVKDDFLRLIEKVGKPNSASKKERSYFG